MMRFAEFFTSGGVLQRNKPIKVWGYGDEKATLTLGSERVEVVPEKGEWTAILSPMPAGGPYTLELVYESGKTVLDDIMIGEVWLAAGQSNMEQCTFATEGGFEYTKGYENPMLRLMTVARRREENEQHYSWNFECVFSNDVKWQHCTEELALHFSGVGFYFADMLQKSLGVAVGIISCNWGGTRIQTWIDEERIKKDPELDFVFEIEKEVLPDYEEKRSEYLEWCDETYPKTNALEECRKLTPYTFARTNFFDWMNEPVGPKCINWPGLLYKNMVLRIAPYTLSGVLWYQGESNAASPDKYCKLFSLLTQNWRELWQDNLPFYTVQIAPYPNGRGKNWAKLIEQQILAVRLLPEVHLVTTGDIGEKGNIHPINKKPVSGKLFAAAMTHHFGKDLEYSGPIYKGFKRKDGEIILEFDHCEGLCWMEGKVTPLTATFEKGSEKEVTAEIRGNKLVVKDEFEEPIAALSMQFDAWFEITLANKSGYCAAPFRTDGVI